TDHKTEIEVVLGILTDHPFLTTNAYTQYKFMKHFLEPVFRKLTPLELTNLSYFDNWFVGFTTAEASDHYIMEAIKTKFTPPNQVRLIAVKNKKPNYVIETHNLNSLAKVIDFFSRTTFYCIESASIGDNDKVVALTGHKIGLLHFRMHQPLISLEYQMKYLNICKLECDKVRLNLILQIVGS
ncbi:hypothetical protein MARPO_YA0035, partial [Marchantia polymorpha]